MRSTSGATLGFHCVHTIGERTQFALCSSRLRRLLVLGAVALTNFALGHQPVFIFLAGYPSVLLPEFVSATTDFFFQVDGHDVFASIGLGFANFPEFRNR